MRKRLSLFLLLFLLAGCAGKAPSPALSTATTAPATLAPSATATFVPTASLTPTDSLFATAMALRTPPALPGVFQTSLQNPVDPPHTYISDTCQYLQDKWSSNNSVPGTTLVAIMFHSISETIGSGGRYISASDFQTMMKALLAHGFTAINMTQAQAFLYHNARIPPLSVLLIVDDRPGPDTFNLYFRPYWEKYQWPVVSAWISTPLNTPEQWQTQAGLATGGFVDLQAHGVVHNIPMWPGVSDSYIMGELQGSIDAFKLHFNKVPIAIIWPGGGFSTHSVQIARQLGYQLGFTTSARGPVLFNWVPLGDKVTPVHGPSWQPEGPMNDPLLLLPRYWDTDIVRHLDTIVQISQQAAAYDQKNKVTEEEYYDIVCAPTLGPLP
ncbi:MAG: polysaccharide deacetylase family protein [Anaerolineales bacterium]